MIEFIEKCKMLIVTNLATRDVELLELNATESGNNFMLVNVYICKFIPHMNLNTLNYLPLKIKINLENLENSLLCIFDEMLDYHIILTC